MKYFVDAKEFCKQKSIDYYTSFDLIASTLVFKRILNEKKFLQSDKLIISGSGCEYNAVETAKTGLK